MKRAKTSARIAHERRLHYRLIRRIYRLCRSGKWILRYANLHGNGAACAAAGLLTASGVPLSTSVGTVDTTRRIIIIDFRSDIISTFVHECLHILVDDRFTPTQHRTEEREVRRLERLMMRHLTTVQAKRLHAHMTNMLFGAAQESDD